MSTSIYLAIPLMTLLAVAQTAALPRFPILGMIPQLPFLVALSWGLLRGVNEGVIWAFIGGLCLDLFSVGPLGATALAFMAAILAVAWIENAMPSSRFFLPILMAALATLIYFFVYLLLLRLLGYPLNLQAATEWLPVALLHGVLVLPIYWLMHLLERLIRPRPVNI
ncbi:MAG: rod shape-determining protein MreD [Chloroflexi bacterium]|nr:rod shape-determining protein MreD [Chloroflexota bacterium]